MLSNTLLAAALLFIPGALTVYLLVKFYRWLPGARKYMANMQTCGFLDDPPDANGQARLMRLSRFFVWLFVGRVQIVGIENLDKVDGEPCVITPNHPSFLDIVVIPYAINRKARFMAARGVMRMFCGTGSLLVGPVGAFCCDLDRGKGGPALKAAVQVLVTGQRLVMFPEGWTYLDGRMHRFKKGAVRIARLAQEGLGKPSYLVPVGLEYGRYPGEWILRLPIQAQYAILILLFPLFRNGVKVTFGEPIASSALPSDDSVATTMLEERVASLINKENV
jgi:1-acyl-sn-glycerol-3-phosphate acyltransferase